VQKGIILTLGEKKIELGEYCGACQIALYGFLSPIDRAGSRSSPDKLQNPAVATVDSS